MENWIIEFLNQYGYFGIAILITVENLFPPIPSELILSFGGFMTTITKMHIPGVVCASTLGSLVGAVILYFLGYCLSPARLTSLINSRLGTLLHFKEEDITSAVHWFNSKGNYTVFLCRFIPIVRSLISIPAGMARMQLSLFLSMTLAGSLIWNTVLVAFGALAGASWQKAVLYMDTYTDVAKGVIIGGMALGCFLWFKRKFT